MPFVTSLRSLFQVSDVAKGVLKLLGIFEWLTP